MDGDFSFLDYHQKQLSLRKLLAFHKLLLTGFCVNHLVDSTGFMIKLNVQNNVEKN